jgi:hypothetical protein
VHGPRRRADVRSRASTDASVIRVTAPGKKQCEGGADLPGDGLPLTSVHPNYTLPNLRPSGLEPRTSLSRQEQEFACGKT